VFELVQHYGTNKFENYVNDISRMKKHSSVYIYFFSLSLTAFAQLAMEMIRRKLIFLLTLSFAGISSCDENFTKESVERAVNKSKKHWRMIYKTMTLSRARLRIKKKYFASLSS
jgi:hypothetical protein